MSRKRLLGLLALVLSAACNATEFQGKIGRTEADSTPDWPAEPAPPAAAPNILVWLLDDVGFAQLGSYGGLTETATLDQLAQSGVRFTDFHATPLCSPSRAALLTGRNPHNVGMGAHAVTATGYPGYNARVPDSAATIARILKGVGYATYALGKWDHLPVEHTTAAGPFDYWPSGQGFEHFYGFLLHEANHFQPTLWRDHTPVTDVDLNNPDYHLTEDLADQAIHQIRELKAINPSRPFFMYWATGAVHAPHHAPASYLEKYRGKFDKGWNAVREVILAKQKKLGVVPADVALPPWPDDVPAWESLSSEQQKMAARMMEAFAAMLDHADDQFARILQALDDVGELDNTIVVVLSDNGASAEGGLTGTFNEMLLGRVSWEDNLRHYAQWGGPETYPHYPVGWAAAGNTPFRYYKQSAFEGGSRVPLIISWPKGIKERGELRSQYHFISDVTPTLLELAGVKAPKTVAGVEQQPLDGVSFAYAIHDAEQATRKQVQYYELWGNRGVWSDGWKANLQLRPRPWEHSTPASVDAAPWQLFNLAEDFNEQHDLADREPQKLETMVTLFRQQAAINNVYPLAPDYLTASVNRVKKQLADRQGIFEYRQGSGRIPTVIGPPVNQLPFTLKVSIDNRTPVKEGVIFSVGGNGGGMALYLKNGRPVLAFRHLLNGLTEIRSVRKIERGESVIEVAMERPQGSRDGIATLMLDGKPVGSGTFKGLSALLPMEETFDVGADYASPVVPGYPARSAIPPGFIKSLRFQFPVAQEINLLGH
ncbi:arylsulfatase [Pseudomaricurvus sp. HS19]|uniref:arylsulfatase n=1 Tax=Pseudomaricurvus sp. HS19 TaxID=2692626 RepID=UPI00136DCB94|nr:arylsulfatase [Pseudomaricurvus sp. HS19]MYM64284.1 sulfatase-like hydrolase/transferase [Pseudomaricurvus sp. HS19]